MEVALKTKVIESAIKGRESEKKVMDGIIKSAVLTDYQRGAIAGIISPMPSHKKSVGSKPLMKKSSASKTPQTIGSRHFPGSSYA